jgi:arginyl-tRNA synthetase
MASAADLPVAVEGLTLQSTAETSRFPGCYPSLNPMDMYRAHIAEKLGAATGIEPEKIYPKLAWTNTLDKGDLVLPVRTLRDPPI